MVKKPGQERLDLSKWNGNDPYSDFIAGIGRFEIEFDVEKYTDIKNLRFDPQKGTGVRPNLRI